MSLHQLVLHAYTVYIYTLETETLHTIIFNKDDCLKETPNSVPAMQKWKLGGPLIEREVKKGRLWLVSKP